MKILHYGEREDFFCLEAKYVEIEMDEMTVEEQQAHDIADAVTHLPWKVAKIQICQALQSAFQRGHRKGQEEMRTRGKSDLLEKAEWWRQQNYEPSADAFECAAEFVGNIPLEGDTP